MNPPAKPVQLAFLIAKAGRPEAVAAEIEIAAGPASEIAEGTYKIIVHESISIGVYRLLGAFYALRNHCPHQGAPLCRGTLHSTHEPSEVGSFQPALIGRILRCPWHGWEFDVITGKGLYSAKGRVRTYGTRVDSEGNIFIILR